MPAASAQGQQSSASDQLKVVENMDHLVKEITENLKLGQDHHHHHRASALKVKNFRRGFHRSSPYAVPPTSRACDTQLGSSPTSRGASQLRKWNHQRRRYPSTCMNPASAAQGAASAAAKDEDDEGVDDPFAMLQELITDGSLIKEAVRRLQKGLFVAANAKTFYDSEDDDECGRTPPNQYTDLCCEVGI